MEPKGPEFFGFSHPTIQNLIQSCPGARKCTGYKWVKYEVSRDGEYYREEDPTVCIDALFKLPSFQNGELQTAKPSITIPYAFFIYYARTLLLSTLSVTGVFFIFTALVKKESGSHKDKGDGESSLRNLLTTAGSSQDGSS